MNACKPFLFNGADVALKNVSIFFSVSVMGEFSQVVDISKHWNCKKDISIALRGVDGPYHYLTPGK